MNYAVRAMSASVPPPPYPLNIRVLPLLLPHPSFLLLACPLCGAITWAEELLAGQKKEGGGLIPAPPLPSPPPKIQTSFLRSKEKVRRKGKNTLTFSFFFKSYLAFCLDNSIYLDAVSIPVFPFMHMQMGGQFFVLSEQICHPLTPSSTYKKRAKTKLLISMQ